MSPVLEPSVPPRPERPNHGPNTIGRRLDSFSDRWNELEVAIRESPEGPSARAVIERDTFVEFPLHEALRQCYRTLLEQADDVDSERIASGWQNKRAFWPYRMGTDGEFVLRGTSGEILVASPIRVDPAENHSFDVFFRDDSTASGWSFRDERARTRMTLRQLSIWIEELDGLLQSLLDDSAQLQALADAQQLEIQDLQREVEALQILLQKAKRDSTLKSKAKSLVAVVSLTANVMTIGTLTSTPDVVEVPTLPTVEQIHEVCNAVSDAYPLHPTPASGTGGPKTAR